MKEKKAFMYIKVTYFLETGEGIFYHVYLTAMDKADNCRGEYLDCACVEDVVAWLREEIQDRLVVHELRRQQLGTAEPKKMILGSGEHFSGICGHL